MQKLRKSNQGFTIIEVLIVLAIAGLILLIVFIAVPALQRNSRNTQRRNDVAAVLGIVNEFANNNNGTLPNTAVLFNGKLAVVSGPTGTQQVEVATSFYDSTAGGALQFTTTAANNASEDDRILLRTGVRCDGSTGNATATGASGRSVVALYTVETASGGANQCQAS